MNTILIIGSPREILYKLFTCNSEGHLEFGWSGRSIGTATTEEILERPVEFRDYIYEGFVKYKLQAKNVENGIKLVIENGGTSQDQYILSQIKFYIAQAGFNLE